tara:strand:- start:436 stop:1635 length:1200 start_codon:yes stop_codon:yes gene_type:complete
MNQCVILVGGTGSRLGDLTKNYPKPMINIGKKPFILYLIDQAVKFGFKDIILLSGHSSGVIEKYFENQRYSDIKIRVIREDKPLGTGGALINAYEYLDQSFFLLNGDSIINGNWYSIIDGLSLKNDVSIALIEKDNCSRYGLVKLVGNKIFEFIEKNNLKKKGLINGGVYCINKKILEGIPLANISFEKDILPFVVKQKKVSGKVIKGYFIDIGTPDSLKKASEAKWEVNRKAVIFDRDGTLNEDNGYTYKKADLKWKPGAKSLIKYLNDENYLVFVATNQAGIAKGYYTEKDMHLFHKEMSSQLRQEASHINKFYFCPFHKYATIKEYKADSNYRKPKIGMLKDIHSEWNLSKDNMVLIGDRDTDIECADNYKIKSILYNGTDNLLDIKDSICKIINR